jgi:type IV pilus assembly protein PilA
MAIPNLLRSRIAANEASAVGSVRTVNTAEITYQATYPKRGFAPNLATLGPDPRGPNAYSAEHASLLDAMLANADCSGDAWCTKSGYHFRVAAVCKQQLCKEYVVVATPVDSNTGTRSFCSTSDGVIRYKLGDPPSAPVSASDCRAWPPLQ